MRRQASARHGVCAPVVASHEVLNHPSALAALDDRRSRDPAAGCPFTKSLARGDAMSQQFESACLIHDRTVTPVEISVRAFLASLGIRSQSAVDETTDAHVRRVGGVAGTRPRAAR